MIFDSVNDDASVLGIFINLSAISSLIFLAARGREGKKDENNSPGKMKGKTVPETAPTADALPAQIVE
jgi:hypothetical protein